MDQCVAIDPGNLSCMQESFANSYTGTFLMVDIDDKPTFLASLPEYAIEEIHT